MCSLEDWLKTEERKHREMEETMWDEIEMVSIPLALDPEEIKVGRDQEVKMLIDFDAYDEIL